ncbi:MAG: undecaprenyl-diphosphate phosphatase [Clostridiales bacterium]|nr:undecaprenyl-diphosphate phosphatase [Clostridiales bacterium]
MSILTAIFQAIAQALSFILPISESGHSAIFHTFSGRYTDACSQLTGVIHIGIAIGIFIACFKLFINQFKNFFASWNDLFHKRFGVKNAKTSRKFMYMTLCSLAILILFLIPTGNGGNLFELFNCLSYNSTLLDEGICTALLGAMLFAVTYYNKPSPKIHDIVRALILGVTAFFAISLSGSSLIVGIFAVGVLIGLNEKNALRYSLVMSVPVLLITGITELVVGVTKVSVLSAIIAVVISVVVTFFAVKLLKYIIKNRWLIYFAIYDVAIGIICLIIGIFQIAIK